MSSQQPAFQQRNHTVDERQKVVPDNGILSNYNTGKACRGQKIIAIPTVGPDSGAWFDSCINSFCQTFSGCINNTLEANAAYMIVFIFNSYEDKCFPGGTSPSSQVFLLRCKFRQPRQYPKVYLVQDGPWHIAICATKSKLSDNYPAPALF